VTPTIATVAKRYFEQVLHHPDGGRLARDFIAGRGLSLGVAGLYGLGAASTSGTGLCRYLTTQGLDPAEAPGLCRRDYDEWRDCFVDRLVFPMHDRRGALVGFTARTLRDDTKYLNQGGSNRHLYGLSETSGIIWATGHVVLVEGQMDALMAREGGMLNAVAIQGSSLGGDQARCLRRHAKFATVIMDGDEAGRKAAAKIVLQLAELKMLVDVVKMPEGMDVADAVQQGHGPRLIRRVMRGLEELENGN
jgi:DNA primase